LSLALALCAVGLVLSASPASAATIRPGPPIPPLAPLTLTGNLTGYGGYGYDNYQVHLTASNGWDVGPTPYYFRIYDTSADNTSTTVVVQCGYGLSCSTTVPPHVNNGGDTFQARIENWSAQEVVATSNTFTVVCGGTGFDDTSPYCYVKS
jgi:hypothetical protein